MSQTLDMTYIHVHPESVYLTNIHGVMERSVSNTVLPAVATTQKGVQTWMAKAASFLQSREVHRCCLVANSHSNLLQPHGR